MVIALAGRRVDAPGAPVRFPAANASRVQNRIRQVLADLGAKALVCSAACGADILALEAAGEDGLRRRVVLPFLPALFRETSVADRPGDWGERYDLLMGEVELAQLNFEPGDETAYAAVNHSILDEAMALAADLDQGVTAIIVWNGTSRGESDLTAAFRDEAARRGLPVIDVLTV